LVVNDLSVVNPLVSFGGTVNGFISSRLMAAYKLDDEHVVHVSRESVSDGRVSWHYVLERNDVVIFEASDFGTPSDTTYGDAARDLVGFLTLQEGDTDDEYFAGYTPEQIAWRDECAEYLAMFGMEDDEDDEDDE
jgi:hypothetical protein